MCTSIDFSRYVFWLVTHKIYTRDVFMKMGQVPMYKMSVF